MFSIMQTIIQAIKDGNNCVPIRITGNSMLPLYKDGDIVYIRSFKDYQINDIIVVARSNHFIVHRLIEKMISDTGECYYLTKGDNNDHVDRWYPKKNILAKVVRQ